MVIYTAIMTVEWKTSSAQQADEMRHDVSTGFCISRCDWLCQGGQSKFPHGRVSIVVGADLHKDRSFIAFALAAIPVLSFDLG